jgi:hypothetical protein
LPLARNRTYTYLVDVLQRISEHPASRVTGLTPRLWAGNGKSLADAVGDGEPAINRSWQPARGGCGDAQQEALLACPMIDELNASKSQSGPIFID